MNNITFEHKAIKQNEFNGLITYTARLKIYEDNIFMYSIGSISHRLNKNDAFEDCKVLENELRLINNI